MIIAFGRTGNERKKLAWAIATIIGTTAEYQYMPTCAYKIGECYTVTKSGDLEISDQADRKETERLFAELANRGYAVPDGIQGLDGADASRFLHGAYARQSPADL